MADFAVTNFAHELLIRLTLLGVSHGLGEAFDVSINRLNLTEITFSDAHWTLKHKHFSLTNTEINRNK